VDGRGVRPYVSCGARAGLGGNWFVTHGLRRGLRSFAPAGLGAGKKVKGGGQECPLHTGGVELRSTGQMGTSAPTWAFLRNKHDVVDEAGFADVGGDGDEGGLVDILSAGFMQFFERVGIDDAEVIEFDAGVLGESLLSCGN